MENLDRCNKLATIAVGTARRWVEEFPNDYKGKVEFCLALAIAVNIMRDLVPVLNGTGQDFIDGVKHGTMVWVELGEPRNGDAGIVEAEDD